MFPTRISGSPSWSSSAGRTAPRGVKAWRASRSSGPSRRPAWRADRGRPPWRDWAGLNCGFGRRDPAALHPDGRPSAGPRSGVSPSAKRMRRGGASFLTQVRGEASFIISAESSHTLPRRSCPVWLTSMRPLMGMAPRMLLLLSPTFLRYLSSRLNSIVRCPPEEPPATKIFSRSPPWEAIWSQVQRKARATSSMCDGYLTAGERR